MHEIQSVRVAYDTLKLPAAGSEDMVVEPWQNLTWMKRCWVQPGMKVRGREYLRLILGADYLEEGNFERLRQRATDNKCNRALREYFPGLVVLQMTAAAAPLWKVHQMVFGVLALKSKPLDPRLQVRQRHQHAMVFEHLTFPMSRCWARAVSCGTACWNDSR